MPICSSHEHNSTAIYRSKAIIWALGARKRFLVFDEAGGSTCGFVVAACKQQFAWYYWAKINRHNRTLHTRMLCVRSALERRQSILHIFGTTEDGGQPKGVLV